MIGLQDLMIKQEINTPQLANELNMLPGRIWNWLQVDRIPEKYLKVLAERFNVEEDYLNYKVNDINTHQPRVKEFNTHEIRGDITAIFLENKKGVKLETIISTKHLEYIKSLKLHWHLKFDVKTKGYYAVAQERYTDENGKRKGRRKHLHIEIMKADFYKGEFVDHRNHNTLDNTDDNLRITTFQLNTKNRHRKNSNNKSGYRNVSKSDNRWIVQLQIDGKNTILKRFPMDQLEEAGAFAEEMRQKYYGEFAGNS